MTRSDARMDSLEGPDRTTGRILLILLIVSAWALYRPELARPFDYVDFPEDILVLQPHEGLREQYETLSQVYAAHGRWKPIANALLAGQWSWFGNWTPGWQLARFAVMVAVLFISFSLFRKLRLGPAGAFAAAAALVVSPPAVMGWLRLSTPEPVGLLLLAIACHVALARAKLAPWLLALLLLGVMWTKEIMTAAFVVPALLVITSSDNGSLRKFQFDRQRLLMLMPSFLVLVVGSLPILWTWRSSPPDSFASRYASSGISFADIAGGSLAAWLPFAPVPEPSRLALLVVIVAFLVLIVAGWQQALEPDELQGHRRVVLLLALGVPVLGAAMYSPWPFYLLIYALPFVLAGSLLMGQAVSSLSVVRHLRAISLSCLTIVLTYALAQAANESSRMRALHRAFAESVTRVAAMQNVDTVLVDVAMNQYDSRGNFGPRFKNYARMLGLEWPHVVDVPCARPGALGPRTIQLRLNLMCAIEGTVPSLVERFARFDWPNPRPQRDSITVSFLAN